MKTYNDDEVKRALNYDGLLEAEKVTGNSYKKDQATSFLGMALTMDNNDVKARMLESRKDNHFRSPASFVRELLTDLGFEQALEQPFTSLEWNYDELYEIWVDPIRAIIYEFDTFGGYKEDRINGSTFHYQLKAKVDNIWGATSSGGFDKINKYDSSDDIKKDYVYNGYHDGREAIRYKIQELEKVASFVNPWLVPKKTLWLTHYVEEKCGNHLEGMESHDFRVNNWNKLTKDKINNFPERLRQPFVIQFQASGSN